MASLNGTGILVFHPNLLTTSVQGRDVLHRPLAPFECLPIPSMRCVMVLACLLRGNMSSICQQFGIPRLLFYVVLLSLYLAFHTRHHFHYGNSRPLGEEFSKMLDRKFVLEVF